MRARKLLAILLPLALLACTGDQGPMGPQGPQGPEGPEGPPGPGSTMFVQTATVGSDGSAEVSFPGLQVESSLVNCWLSDEPDGPWSKIGTDIDGPQCGARNSGNDMLVRIAGAPPGWHFMVTAVTGP